MSHLQRLAAISAGLLVSVSALADPLPPKPLWPLVAEADLIVVAKVSAVNDRPRSEGDWNSAVARLEVIETLKGPRLDDVDVPFPATLACPAPPRYDVGETVVAFLRERDEAWQTASLSYGTLYPRGAELKDMVALVRAATDIQQTEDHDERMRRKQEWLVQATSLPGTRWHGLKDLAPLSSFGDGTDDLRLDPRHVELLARAFVEAPRYDRTFPWMLRLLDDADDPRIDELTLGVMEGLLVLEETPLWGQELLKVILARRGDAQPQVRLDSLGLEPWDIERSHLRRVWSQAKSELKIPDVPAMEIELSEEAY